MHKYFATRVMKDLLQYFPKIQPLRVQYLIRRYWCTQYIPCLGHGTGTRHKCRCIENGSVWNVLCTGDSLSTNRKNPLLFFWSIDNALTAISCSGGSPFCPLSRSTSNSMCEYANKPKRHTHTHILFNFSQWFCIKDLIRVCMYSNSRYFGPRPTKDRHKTQVLPQFLFIFESFPKIFLPKVLMKKNHPNKIP